MKGASLELSIMLMKMRLDDRDDSTGKEKKHTSLSESSFGFLRAATIGFPAAPNIDTAPAGSCRFISHLIFRWFYNRFTNFRNALAVQFCY